MPIFKHDPKKDADALLQRLADLQANILSYELRCSFLADLRERSERLVAEFRDRADSDPHKAIASMLRTAALGLREDEFNAAKLDALRQCLVVLSAGKMAPEEVGRCHSAMLWAGLLGYGFSGGKRATVDGKY
jgi:hypothetical protein